MTPQASFLYAAEIGAGEQDAVRALLLGMNAGPGVANGTNGLIPFDRFPRLHTARVLVVTDLAAADRAVYKLPVAGLPDYLVLMGEVDGSEEEFRAELLAKAGDGLRRLFSHCAGFAADTDLARWMAGARVRSAADYVNWAGRTVQQASEEEALRRALESYVDGNLDALRRMEPRALHLSLQRYVRERQARGELGLTPEAATPWLWQLRNVADLIAVPLVLLLALPLLILLLPVYVVSLRGWERRDVGVAPPVALAHAEELEAIENQQCTNQFSVFGSLKPGRLRLWSMLFFLWVTGYTARHVFNKGGLARVSTIHFARWVPFDGGQRMLFSSVYDGSLESYMDDFINKVGFGLNITFSNGIGYPRTRWLVRDGCRDEQVFKRVLRRHQLATEVWYDALPGLTAANLHRNSLLRSGLERTTMTDAEVRTWIALL